MLLKKDIPRTTRPSTQGVELHALYRITRLIGNAVQLELTLSRILEILNDTLQLERATLLLYDRLKRKLTIKASCGLSADEKLRGTYSPDEGIIGKIFRSKSPFSFPTSTANRSFSAEPAPGKADEKVPSRFSAYR